MGRPAPPATSARTVRIACGAWRRHVQGQLLADRVPVGDAAAGLDRGDVDPRDVDVLGDAHLGGGDGRIGRGPIAGFPVPDVVVRLVRPAIGPEHEGIGLERLERVDDDRQRLVVDEDGGDAVGGGVARGGDDRGDLLGLVHHGVDRQHHLHVAGQRRHPGQLVAVQVLAGHDRGDARDLERLGRVDRLDLGVGVRAADDVEPELARQVDVVDVLALAADEARVFLALDRVAHAADLGGWCAAVGFCGHVVTPRSTGRGRFGPVCVACRQTGRSSPAACWIALTMFT